MMNNKLIQTNGIWYKIKRFFQKIFGHKKSFVSNEESTIEIKEKNDNSKFTNDLREKFEKEHKNHDLANKLLYGEIGPSELNEQEVDEMTEYFKKDIQNIDNELLRIKQHILYMQKELKS